MKLSTSTNIMVYDLKIPYQVPIDISVKACAKAGYKDIDANLCGFCRPGQPLFLNGWEKWAHDVRALGEELGISFSQCHAYWTIGNAFHPDLTRTDGELGEDLMRRSVITAKILGAKWMVVHPYSISTCGGYDYKKSFA